MGAYTLLQDLTVATNSTSVVLNDFGTITKDDFVKVMITNVNNSGGATQYRLFPTSNTNSTNYHVQILGAFGSTVFAVRSNENRYGGAGTGQTSTSIVYVKLTENDKFNLFSTNNFNTTSTVENYFLCTTQSTGTTTSITSFTVSARDTNGIGTGSRIQIYRLDAEKIADITVASNTTQVDISNLSIDKDSEYLLVADAVGSSGDIFLHVNDDTTAANYHRQRIVGNGSTASAARGNDARFLECDSTAGGLAYVHIKLSNIGAYTAQAYTFRQPFTSSLQITNNFISSTSEAITSITKLNIKGGTNNIAAGSRFILYKLYE